MYLKPAGVRALRRLGCGCLLIVLAAVLLYWNVVVPINQNRPISNPIDPLIKFAQSPSLPFAQAPLTTAVPGQPTAIRTLPPGTVPPAGARVPTSPAQQAKCTYAIDFGGVPYAPYSIVMGAAARTAAKYDLCINYIDLYGAEAQQRLWPQNLPPDQYFPPLDDNEKRDPRFQQTSRTRILATTQSNPILTNNSVMIYVLDESKGVDKIVVRNKLIDQSGRVVKEIKTLNDVCEIPYLGLALGSVSEVHLKQICGSLGLKVGRFDPTATEVQAQTEFKKNPAYLVLSIYDPYASEVLDSKSDFYVPDARVLLSSKSVCGIYDVLVMRQGAYDESVTRFLKATVEFFNFALKSPSEGYQIIKTYADANGLSDAFGYQSFQDWSRDLQGAALATSDDNIRFFTIGKSILAQRNKDTQDVLNANPTFLKGADRPFELPKRDPESVIDDQYVKKLVPDLQSTLRTDTVPSNHALCTGLYAPAQQTAGKTVKVMATYEHLQLPFAGSTDKFADPFKAVDEIQKKVVSALRIMTFTFQIRYADDSLGLARAQAVRDILVNPTFGFSVPTNRFTLTPDRTMKPGDVQYFLIGVEE